MILDMAYLPAYLLNLRALEVHLFGSSLMDGELYSPASIFPLLLRRTAHGEGDGEHRTCVSGIVLNTWNAWLNKKPLQ